MSGNFFPLGYCVVGQILKKIFHRANDFRHGVEGKSWLAQTEQAKLYFNQAQEALESVKVVSVIIFLRRDAHKLSHVPIEICRRSDRNPAPERRHTLVALHMGAG